VAENFGTSFRLTDSRYFVIEADEYDTAYFDKGPKMWHYLPDTAIVNNIEFDHADIYRDEEAYRFAFARFINLIPGTGRWSPAGTRRSCGSWRRAPSPARVVRLARAGSEGELDAAPARAGAGGGRGVRHDRTASRCCTTARSGAGGDAARRRVQRAELPGRDRGRDAVGADPEGVREGLRTFRSVRRRMEVRGEAGRHRDRRLRAPPHRGARDARGRAAALTGRPLVAVFEPRSYTAQRREFQEPYLQAFDEAPPWSSPGSSTRSATPRDRDEPHELVAGCAPTARQADYIPEVDEIVHHLGGGSRATRWCWSCPTAASAGSTRSCWTRWKRGRKGAGGKAPGR
jgi:UDP-N-acetylmuramate: L-alanyl-gamma-D-glutamyl-meso-diaminopimelate ligase